MVDSADYYYPPNKEERGIIQSEIIALENEVMDVQKVIEQAQLRLDALTQQLNERKYRIAPVRRANFDILSSIFERCSEIDWMSPWVIAVVSRRWRKTILHTPRAWRFIDLAWHDTARINTYLERSGQCGLHVAFGYPEDFALLTQVSHRVQCLAISVPLRHLKNLTFPSLTRLRTRPLGYTRDFDNPAVIVPSRFPNLHHLELRNKMEPVENCEELPSLQILRITIINGDGWGELLRACKDSLVSLQITSTACRGIFQVPEVELPNLRYLKIVDEGQTDCSWASPLVTPALRVYWEETNCSVAQEPRSCAESVTHLRLMRVPSAFPMQLRALQLDISIVEFRSLISDLKKDGSLCPHLEILEFGRKYVTDFELAEMEKMLDECDWQARPRLLCLPTITAKWSASLPDEIEAEVRYWWLFEPY
jgi:hypothetical protein